MTILYAVATICAAALLMSLLWQAKRMLYRRAIGGKKTRVTVIVTSDGNPAELEQSVLGLLWLMDNHTLDPQTGIVIKNAGMNSETAAMARILEREHEAVTLDE